MNDGWSALAGVALAGVLGLIGFYIKARLDLERDVRTKHFEERLDVYRKVYDFTWSFYQTGSAPPTVEQVREINKGLVLVGSPGVLRAFHGISEASAEKLKKAGLTEDQVRAKQAEVARTIFIAIRRDLYPHQKELRREDIRFIEPKRPHHS